MSNIPISPPITTTLTASSAPPQYTIKIYPSNELTPFLPELHSVINASFANQPQEINAQLKPRLKTDTQLADEIVTPNGFTAIAFAGGEIVGTATVKDWSGVEHIWELPKLRREKRELKEEMRSLTGTIQNARNAFPDLYQRHDEISRKLTKLRKALRDNTRQTARKDYFHAAPVLEINRQIQQLLGNSSAEDCDADSAEDGDEDWQLPIPDYVFPERARLVESFYGPEGECFDEDRLLARRIQVTEDFVALSHLCEPNRRGKRTNWDGDDEQSETSEVKEAFLLEEKSSECPTDVCIICCGISRRSPSNPPPHKFPSKRKDSLRRHLIDSHLMNAHDGVRCTWETCGELSTFIDVAGFLAHAANVHHYDLHIKLERIPKRQRLSRDGTSSSSSPIRSLRSSQLGTETPASSVDIEIGKIDPRLLATSNIKSNETYRRSQRLKHY